MHRIQNIFPVKIPF